MDIPQNVKNEMIEYLLEGNTKEELAEKVFDLMSDESRLEMINELKEAHKHIGDYPYADAFKA